MQYSEVSDDDPIVSKKEGRRPSFHSADSYPLKTTAPCHLHPQPQLQPQPHPQLSDDTGQHLSEVQAVPVLFEDVPQQQSPVQQSPPHQSQQSQVQQSGITDSQPHPQSQLHPQPPGLVNEQFSHVILNAEFLFGQLQFAIKKISFHMHSL